MRFGRRTREVRAAEECSFLTDQKGTEKVTATSDARSTAWGLHAPKTPNKEVGRPTGYANAVLLFALNACGPSSTLNSGVPPNPRRVKRLLIFGAFCMTDGSSPNPRRVKRLLILGWTLL